MQLRELFGLAWARIATATRNSDTRTLTKKQMLVYILDGEGLTPTEIGKRLKLTAKRVCNIKHRLKEMGHNVAVYRGFTRRIEATVQPGELPVAPSPLEPADDEMPDADEPVYAAIERCSCGLILPCYHAPVSPWQNKGCDSRYDDVGDVQEASIENSIRAPKRKAKALGIG